VTDFYQAQLFDGRWVRMRELTSGDQIRAAAAATVILVDGRVPLEGEMKMRRELLKMALVAVSGPLPKPRSAPALLADGTPKTETGPDGAPRPVFERVEVVPTDKDWQPLTYSALETSFDELFGARQRAQIQLLYDHVHLLIPAEDGASFFESIRSVASST